MKDDDVFKLQELPLDVLGQWLVEGYDENAPLLYEEGDVGFSLFIRNRDGTMMRVTRVFAELEAVRQDEVKNVRSRKGAIA